MPTSALEENWDFGEPEDLHELLQSIVDVRRQADVARIRRAYYVAEKAHTGQRRGTGEPYITHPLAVAKIIAGLQMDDESIIAALLHDVLEDSAEFTPEVLRTEFGEQVQHLVEGVTKLQTVSAGDSSPRKRRAAETHRMAESLRKMLLAMAKDFRVMVIKLADRLHNMQTLMGLDEQKRVRIANETLDLYAPLAARLGIWQIKWQLEDLAFQHLHPEEYKQIRDMVKDTREAREKDIREAVLALKDRFSERGIKVIEIQGRPKHLFSIYHKMVSQKVTFEDIHDLLALRIIVRDKVDCYSALGIVHEAWMPLEGMFGDYIAKPKPNGYQSLHTKVMGPGGRTLEVQIRTVEMHRIAEYGVAAHWTYKEGDVAPDERARLGELRQQLFNWSTDAKTSGDYLRSLNVDLFSEQVFVFTPKGDVLDLPKDSTPVDFAFRVHSEIGMRLVGAKVNGAIVPLSTKLKNGDVVDLVTRSNAQPSLHWLEFVKSAHARSKLRTHFRRVTRDQDAIRGRDALERELRALGVDPKLYLGEDKLTAVAKTYDGCETGVDLLAKIGSSLITVQGALMKLRPASVEAEKVDQIYTTRTREGKLQHFAKGMESIAIHRAKCCCPIPGDEVVGYVTRGRGMMIHRRVCPNTENLATSEPGRLMAYEWPRDGNAYPVTLKITSVNRPGLLMDISTVFAESKANVTNARVRTLPNHTAEIEITVELEDVAHLQAVMAKISNFADVISIFRTYGRSAAR